jgi:hypothetical protein
MKAKKNVSTVDFNQGLNATLLYIARNKKKLKEKVEDKVGFPFFISFSFMFFLSLVSEVK